MVPSSLFWVVLDGGGEAEERRCFRGGDVDRLLAGSLRFPSPTPFDVEASGACEKP